MLSRTEDLKLAESLLTEEDLNLVIVKEGQVLLSSAEHGVAPFFRAAQTMASSLHGAVAADHIVGLAVAMLCIHTHIAAVYAGTASQGALDTLSRQGVPVVCGNVVPYIRNNDGTGLCPFEKLAQDSGDPARLFSALEAILAGSGKDDGKTLTQ
jgi:hypothetical protein